MTIVTRRIQFCAGHRVMGHEGKCNNLHGHNWVAMITAHADGLDAVGRVIDFSVLKDRVGKWIDARWDHGFIVCTSDIEARRAMSAVAGQKIYLLPGNPTAENLAAHLLYHVCPSVLTGTRVTVVKVELWETENCKAEVSK